MSLYNAIAETFRTGKEKIVQSLAIAAASATITTPYKSVDGVLISLNVGVAPAITDSIFFTWTFSAGTVTIFAWKFTSNANPTYIAGAAACTVSVEITGRRR